MTLLALDPSSDIVEWEVRLRLMARLLIIIGLTLVVVGLLWPWIAKIGIGRLPGDILIERGSFKLYLPITTSILVSLVLSLILWLINR